MNTLKPLDLSFLLMENATRRMHMNAFMVFDLPPDGREDFIARLLEALRARPVASPFDRKLKWLGAGVAKWERAEPNMSFHVRHLALPRPGTTKQFYELVSWINGNVLDRGHPLWECYLIEGLEGDRFALMLKIHHSLIDGEAGLKVLFGFLSDDPQERTLRAPWAPSPEDAKAKRSGGGRMLGGLLKRLTNLPQDVVGLGLQATTLGAGLGAQALGLATPSSPVPFGAQQTLFNRTAQSSERRYANCELPLPVVKAVAKATGTSVNDVAMAIIDEALHRYLALREHAGKHPLVAFMPMSTRAEGEQGGNQVTVDIVRMGQPDAAPLERLAEIHEATARAKEKGRRLPRTVRDIYGLLVIGSMTAGEVGSVMSLLPTCNLVISNMKGPAEQLYLAGAPMRAFHGLPIVPPGCGLNITFASINDTLCLAIGAAPEAVDDPFLMTGLIASALDRLATEVVEHGKPATGEQAAPPERSAATTHKKSTARRTAKPTAKRTAGSPAKTQAKRASKPRSASRAKTPASKEKTT